MSIVFLHIASKISKSPPAAARRHLVRLPGGTRLPMKFLGNVLTKKQQYDIIKMVSNNPIIMQCCKDHLQPVRKGSYTHELYDNR